MTVATVLNANDPDYWVNVKRKAALRKGINIVKRKLQVMRPSTVYEQYIADVLYIVKDAAQTAGMTSDADRYLEFKASCADELRLPELMADERDIAVQSDEAVADAYAALYGEAV